MTVAADRFATVLGDGRGADAPETDRRQRRVPVSKFTLDSAALNEGLVRAAAEASTWQDDVEYAAGELTVYHFDSEPYYGLIKSINTAVDDWGAVTCPDDVRLRITCLASNDEDERYLQIQVYPADSEDFAVTSQPLDPDMVAADHRAAGQRGWEGMLNTVITTANELLPVVRAAAAQRVR